MKTSQYSLPQNKAELKEIVLSQDKEIQRLNEENRLLRHALFGAKSEKLPVGPNTQLPLFDMPENPSEETEKEIIVPEHSRQKKGRRKLPEDLPRIDVTHDIDPEEK